MEVTQRLQPTQDEACQLFVEIEGWGVEMEQVVTTVELFLEGPINEATIQEFIEKKTLAQHQVEIAWSKLEDFEAELLISKWLGMSHRWVLGACWTSTKFWGNIGRVWPILDFDRLVEDGAPR